MAKSYTPCPKCGKKGFYKSYGYPKETDMRCRYCGHETFEIPEQHLEIDMMTDNELIEAYNENCFGKLTLESLQGHRRDQMMYLLYDKLNVGTKDYEGHAYFWHHEYRHDMRWAEFDPDTPEPMYQCVLQMMRKECHDELLKLGLPLAGMSPQHGRIMSKHHNRAAKRAKAFVACMKGEEQ